MQDKNCMLTDFSKMARIFQNDGYFRKVYKMQAKNKMHADFQKKACIFKMAAILKNVNMQAKNCIRNDFSKMERIFQNGSHLGKMYKMQAKITCAPIFRNRRAFSKWQPFQKGVQNVTQKSHTRRFLEKGSHFQNGGHFRKM